MPARSLHAPLPRERSVPLPYAVEAATLRNPSVHVRPTARRLVRVLAAPAEGLKLVREQVRDEGGGQQDRRDVTATELLVRSAVERALQVQTSELDPAQG